MCLSGPFLTPYVTYVSLCILMHDHCFSPFTQFGPEGLGFPTHWQRSTHPDYGHKELTKSATAEQQGENNVFPVERKVKEKNKQNITKWYNAARFLHSSHLFTTSPSPSPLHKIWVWEEIVVDLLVYLYQAAWSSMSGWRLLYLAQTRDRMQWFISVALESTPCTWSKSIKT